MTGGTVVVTVPPDAQGARLDRFLTHHVAGRTRSFVQRLIREGRVTVDGAAAAKPGHSLRPGMRVRVDLPVAPSDDLLAEAIPVAVVAEDDAVIVIDKPAGLVVHPGHGCHHGTLVNALLGLGVPLAPAGGRMRPGIVHRLDRETSGLLVVAKTDAAHRALARAFAERRVRKEYRAVVWGHPDPPSGTISKPIGRSRTDRTRMSVHAPRGRSATTRFRTLQSVPGFAYLEVEIETGRTHQIRVHLQSIHHPVVGDAHYGGRGWKGLVQPAVRAAVRDFSRLALHASRLTFPHPATGRDVTYTAELPGDFASLLAVLRNRA
jgi:23S rRNA pseudouridine1911/1915/1917 synthase